MAEEKKTLQDRFLEELRAKKVECVLFTMNGVQIHGVVKSFDHFTILLENSERNKQDFVYKHAVSTISPKTFVRLDGAG